MTKGTNRLRGIRRALEISQEDVAQAADLKPSTYWRIEHGYVQPEKDVQKRIAKALKVAVKDLGFESAAS
jgi:transcriptional regulator with XRE-family HTH domain